jgi:hypothetical protein
VSCGQTRPGSGCTGSGVVRERGFSGSGRSATNCKFKWGCAPKKMRRKHCSAVAYVTLRREIFLLSEDFISRLSFTGVWGQRPRSKSEQPSRDDNNFGPARLGCVLKSPIYFCRVRAGQPSVCQDFRTSGLPDQLKKKRTTRAPGTSVLALWLLPSRPDQIRRHSTPRFRLCGGDHVVQPGLSNSCHLAINFLISLVTVCCTLSVSRSPEVRLSGVRKSHPHARYHYEVDRKINCKKGGALNTKNQAFAEVTSKRSEHHFCRRKINRRSTLIIRSRETSGRRTPDLLPNNRIRKSF